MKIVDIVRDTAIVPVDEYATNAKLISHALVENEDDAVIKGTYHSIVMVLYY